MKKTKLLTMILLAMVSFASQAYHSIYFCRHLDDFTKSVIIHDTHQGSSMNTSLYYHGFERRDSIVSLQAQTNMGMITYATNIIKFNLYPAVLPEIDYRLIHGNIEDTFLGYFERGYDSDLKGDYICARNKTMTLNESDDLPFGSYYIKLNDFEG